MPARGFPPEPTSPSMPRVIFPDWVGGESPIPACRPELNPVSKAASRTPPTFGRGGPHSLDSPKPQTPEPARARASAGQFELAPSGTSPATGTDANEPPATAACPTPSPEPPWRWGANVPHPAAWDNSVSSWWSSRLERRVKPGPQELSIAFCTHPWVGPRRCSTEKRWGQGGSRGSQKFRPTVRTVWGSHGGPQYGAHGTRRDRLTRANQDEADPMPTAPSLAPVG